jgi:hypothetical protein
MKKIFVLALLCASFVQLKAQSGVVFKIKYLPNHNYQMVMNMGMKINATLSGDSAIVDKLKTEGITQPMNIDLQLGMNGSSKSGAVGADKSFPLNMDYQVAKLAVSANGKQAPIPSTVTGKDMKIAAHVTPDGIMTIDSVSGKKANDTAKQKMQQMMSLFQKEIQFPTKPMKPGDTFTQGGPINIPVDGKTNITVNASVTYKLISISDGKAYFDMVPNLDMNFSMTKVSVAMSGTGTGKMVYSIKDNFPLSKEGTFNLKIKVTSGKINVDATGIVTTSATTTIN